MSVVKAAANWAASSTIAHVGFAFFAMGGWAVFANRAHALPQALTAGVVQGTMSGLITLCLKKSLEWMNPRFSGAAALIAPPLITAATILAVLMGAHTLAHTPEIAATIAVPFAVSTTYAVIYNLKLARGA